MKTITKIIAAVFALTILSCSKESENVAPKVITDFPVIEVEADIDAPVVEVPDADVPDTKLYGAVDGTTHSVYWKAGDQISQFCIVNVPGTSGLEVGDVINFSNLRSTLKDGDGTKTFTMPIPDLKTLYGASSGLNTCLCAIYPATTLDVTVTSGTATQINATATPVTPLTIPDVQDGTGWKYSIFMARSATFSAQYNNPTGNGKSTFTLKSVVLRLKLNTTKNITKVVLSNTTGFMTGNVTKLALNSFHYAADAYKNLTISEGCSGKTLTVETGGVLPNDLYFAIREVREGTTFTFTFTAEDGTTTTRSFSNPAGYDNRKMRGVYSLGTITLNDWS